MTDILNFYDNEGNLFPLEEIQEKIKGIYSEIEKENSLLSKETCLSTLADPDFQINAAEVIKTVDFLNREIYINDVITPELAFSIKEKINAWNYIDSTDGKTIEERNPIKIYLNTPGGDLCATLSIIDSIILSNTPIWTINISTAYSGGFFIGLVGDKRIAYPHSSFLFHEGSTMMGGDAHKVMQSSNFYQKQLRQLKDIVLKYSAIDENLYESFKKDDVWFTAEEALKKGIVDEITDTLV